MKILIGCEYSGVVRDAFIAKGHNVISCDFLPTEKSGPHYQGDILDILNKDWDLAIFFPSCTYLCSSGLHWNQRIKGRQKKTEEALDFVRTLLNAPINKIALENPVGCISTKIRKPDQIIQPWQFGEDASKKTCLWLKNLPLLQPTHIIKKQRYANQTASGQNNLPPSKDRWKIRSKTYQGIANCMAETWG